MKNVVFVLLMTFIMFGADWKEQAAKKAESYLDMMAFSKEELIEQLEFEGFTNEEAVYGVTAVGY